MVFIKSVFVGILAQIFVLLFRFLADMSLQHEERLLCDPSIGIADLEYAFTEYFALASRDLQCLLDKFACETWKTAPKASGCSFYRE